MNARRAGRYVVAALLGLGLVGQAQAAEVVVYSARSSQYGPEPAFDAFTKKTGIQVKTFGGNTSELFERLKAEGDKTPADVLITVDAGNLWNAARAGLLSRVDSPEILANIPAHLRDPESRWVGLTVRARTIMYNTKKVKPEELSTYEALGDPKWKGRLCLRTSSYIYNQSFAGDDDQAPGRGEDRGGRARRGSPTSRSSSTATPRSSRPSRPASATWASTNTYYLARLVAKDPGFPVAPFWANQQTTGTHINISGAGVTAHAKNRANAIKLLEFLSSPEAQQMFADTQLRVPGESRRPR